MIVTRDDYHDLGLCPDCERDLTAGQEHHSRCKLRAEFEPETLIPARSVALCRWCLQVIVDGREDSGANEYDPMTLGGDFGCDQSPDTGEDGTGGHELRPLTPGEPNRKGALPTDWSNETVTFQVLV